MKKQQGLTLIEILIALALGLFIIAATLTLFINTVKSSSDTIKSVRLNHDLEMALNLIGNDIKRAGYWGNAKINANSRINPFTDDALSTPATTARTNIQILTANSTTVADPGTCILYTYDFDDDGRVDAETAATGDTDADGKIDNEYYGFRLINNTLQMRVSGTKTDDCTTSGNSNSWQEFIDGNMINITGLQFSFTALNNAVANLTATSRCWNLTTTATPSTNNTINCAGITPTPNPATTAAPNNIAVRRVVNITLTGQLKDDPDVTKSVSSTVEIRNNRLYQKTS